MALPKNLPKKVQIFFSFLNSSWSGLWFMVLALGHISKIIGARAIWKMVKNGPKWPPKWKWATVAQWAHPKPNPIWQTTTMVRYLTSIYTLGGLGIWPKPASGESSLALYLKKEKFLTRSEQNFFTRPLKVFSKHYLCSVMIFSFSK